MQHRQDDWLFEQTAGHLLLHSGQQAVIAALPAGEQLVAVVEHLDVSHLFGGGNQRQCLISCAAVVEHHRSFNGVIDRAGNQVQVVVGIHPQRQHAEHGNGNTSQAHCQ
ncbi:hypothetical protein D3C78_645130 [compost metagenome]